MFTVAIIGRPNVGKSTLFNRLVGRRLALVDDSPGVTRDIREGLVSRGSFTCRVLDTAGVGDPDANGFGQAMISFARNAAETADVCLFTVDARAGVTALDQELAASLRRTTHRLLLLANKAEGSTVQSGVTEFFALGLGEPLAISAEHGDGIDELFLRLQEISNELDEDSRVQNDDWNDVDVPVTENVEPIGVDRPLRISVIGRPNAGKSTLVNRILGRDRFLTGPEAGITRDSNSVRFDWNGTPVQIWDTAGLRKKARVVGKVEKLSVADALRAVQFSEVVVVLVETDRSFESQDSRIIDLVAREGRAIVVAVNKWDLADERQHRLRVLREEFRRLLPQVKGTPLVPVSALTGLGLKRLHSAVLSAHDVWNRRVPTGELNRWLAGMVAAHPPPAPGGRRVKMRYITQAKTRPPGFVVMCSRPDHVGDDYRRYLVNGIRDAFELPGTPIRLTLRSRPERNPFRPS